MHEYTCSNCRKALYAETGIIELEAYAISLIDPNTPCAICGEPADNVHPAGTLGRAGFVILKLTILEARAK